MVKKNTFGLIINKKIVLDGYSTFNYTSPLTLKRYMSFSIT